MYDLVLRDATLVSSAGRQVADVAIKDGKIAYVGPRPPRGGRQELSAMGKFLMPGVIDTAVHVAPNSDPSVWERESRAALSGGVTTILALPGGDHPVVDRASARTRAEAASDRSWVDFGLWAQVDLDDVGPARQAADAGDVLGLLTRLPADGVDVLPPATVEALLGARGVLGLDAEDDHELVAVRSMVETSRATERAMHLVRVSTAGEIQLLDPVHGDVPVTAGVTPHHLFLSTETLTDPVSAHPPVRGEHDRRALWTAVRRGRLDCVTSDHHAVAEGVPGTELLLPLMLSAVQHGRLALEMLVALCSESPARIFGLETKGRIAKGADADLVLFSEGEVLKVRPETLLSGAGWTPYADREAAPKPELVLQAGRIVARRGDVVAPAPQGRYLRRTTE